MNIKTLIEILRYLSKFFYSSAQRVEFFFFSSSSVEACKVYFPLPVTLNILIFILWHIDPLLVRDLETENEYSRCYAIDG
jgi:hypothetical protein